MSMGLQKIVHDPQRMKEAFDLAGAIKHRFQQIVQGAAGGDTSASRLALLLLAGGLSDAMRRSELSADEALLVCACLEQARRPCNV